MGETHHRLPQEILLQRALAIHVVLEGDVSIGGERAGEDGDVAEDGFPGRLRGVRT